MTSGKTQARVSSPAVRGRDGATGGDPARRSVAVLGALLTVAFFAIDVALPSGIASGVPYVAVVLVSAWLPDRFTLIAAGACTVLIALGYLVSPPGGEPWMVVVNRFLAIFAIWVTAALLLLRKKAEREKEESGARTAAILDTAVDPIVTVDEHGVIESANSACKVVFGYQPEELLGKNVSILMPSPYGEEHDDYLARYLATGERRVIGIGREVEGRRKDGTVFPLEIAVSEFSLGGRRAFTGILRDLSERKAAERKLVERESLAKLGELSAMVAHEVKNPIAGIIGAATMLGDRLPQGSEEREIAAALVARAESLDESVKDMLAYSRTRMPAKQPVPVDTLLEDVVALVLQDPQFARIEIDCDAPRTVLACDPEMLKTALLNLVVNAAQAMRGEGRISITASNDGSGPRDAPVRLAIADRGPGIPPELHQRVFEPFFTTKGAGTGLGLPIARRVIELHGGEISIECPPEGGTRVVVRLPAA